VICHAKNIMTTVQYDAMLRD